MYDMQSWFKVGIIYFMDDYHITIVLYFRLTIKYRHRKGGETYA